MSDRLKIIGDGQNVGGGIRFMFNNGMSAVLLLPSEVVQVEHWNAHRQMWEAQRTLKAARLLMYETLVRARMVANDRV